MNEKLFYLGEGDDKVLLAFNLNVMAEIQNEYGSVQNWVELLEDNPDEDGNLKRNGEPDMKAFLTGFAFMLNEGVEIENEKPENSDKPKKPYTLRQVGRMVGKWGKDTVGKAMADAIAGSTDTGESSKNELSTTTSTKA